MRRSRLQQRRVNKSSVRLMNPSRYIPIQTSRIDPERLLLLSAKQAFLTEKRLEEMKKDMLTPKGLTGGVFAKNWRIVFHLNATKIFTKKGILVRMGKGKGKISAVGTYLRPNQLCIELVSKSAPVDYSYGMQALLRYLSKYSFLYPHFCKDSN